MSKLTLLRAARRLADFGIASITLRGKRPTLKWGWITCPLPDADLQWMLRSTRRPTGIAALCGQRSGGLLVRDWDSDAAYHAWAERHPALAAELATVKTRRGYHAYCRGPHGCPTQRMKRLDKARPVIETSLQRWHQLRTDFCGARFGKRRQ